MTRLVVIGSGLDVKGITKCLDDCLITEEQQAKIKSENGITNMVFEGEDPFTPNENESINSDDSTDIEKVKNEENLKKIKNYDDQKIDDKTIKRKRVV